MSSINFKGQLIELDKPRVMGILNITTDSFYDGGKYQSEESILKRAEQIIVEGADFIDIGAFSSRPGAELIPEDQELKKLIPAIQLILGHFPDAKLSIDTCSSRVAEQVLDLGVGMINDISGGKLDPQMISTVSQFQVPYVAMHMPGTPKDMQRKTQYEDLVKDLIYYFSEIKEQAYKNGLNDLIIDPGFGFGKTLEQNYDLLRKLKLFQILELPMLVGISRKSMLYKALGIGPDESLNASSVAHTIALENDVNILRVHDVKQAVETCKIFELYKG